MLLMIALVVSIFLADEGWAALSKSKSEKLVCSNNGVKVTVDTDKKRTFITRKKGSKLVTVPMGRVKKSEKIIYGDQRKSVFKLSNKSIIEVSFSRNSALGLGYGTLTSGDSGRMYDLGDCLKSVN